MGIIPFIKDIYDINACVVYWKSDLVQGDMITNWLDYHGNFLYFMSFILCTTYGAMELVNSNLFGLRAFSMGLGPALHRRFRKQRVSVLLFANIPQSIVQMICMFHYLRLDEYGILALIASILSIIAYVYHSFISFNYNYSDSKSMLLSCRVSSISIAAKANLYSNKCEILGKYLSKKLKINKKNKERLDILPAIQYY